MGANITKTDSQSLFNNAIAIHSQGQNTCRIFLKESCIHSSNLHKQYMHYSESQVCKHEIMYEPCCHSVSKAEIVAQCHTYT